MKFSTWIKVVARLAPWERTQRYATWRAGKVIPEEWIDVIEKEFPGGPMPVVGKPVSVTERTERTEETERTETTESTGGVGLGDVIKAVTEKLGIKQCGGCKKRQAYLNKIRLG